ncbi:MAG TPA: hypothetical protein VN643_05780 [Pyrinomonadaceae bacterium]|nr:hypothetical protein [Pyrinomonadaceae bacterium]
MKTSDSKVRWRFGLLAAAIVTLIATSPQLYFAYSRGSQWNGSYAQTHGDEGVYASYLNALIDGRPQRNNPYSGRDNSPEHPMAESYLSLQFFPPFIISRTARLLRISTAKALIALTAIIAFTSALAVFWLLASIIGENRAAAIGVLVVLLAGSANLVIEHLLGFEDSNNYLPFLRRYLPAAPFPILFAYCALTWRMLTAVGKRIAPIWALSAGALFAVLTFSYVYHWSFALIWTCCLAALWLIARPRERRHTLSMLSILAVCVVASLIPYLSLAAKLEDTTAEKNFLALSRAPDLFRLTEILGLVVLIAIAFLISRRRMQARDPAVLFAVAFALTPFVLFNQQVTTGRSLQPFHYEVFIGSYTTVLAAFVTVILGGRSFTIAKPAMARLLLIGIAGLAVLSGAAEATLLSRRQRKGNLLADEVRPALLRLASLARESPDGTLDTRSVVYAPNFVVTGAIPTTAPQPVLWAQYLFVFPDVTLSEDKERLAQFLYYKGVSFTDIDPNHFNSLNGEKAYYLSSLISRGRFNSRLSVDWKPIAPEEVIAARDYYASFVAAFDRARAAHPQISFLLVASDDQANLSNFDRWYERDQGERIGKYILFRVRLRS